MSDIKISATGSTQITIERHFDADTEAVVKAFLEPDLLMKWMGGPDMPLQDVGVDPRPGGVLRYVWGGADGQKMVLTGQFLNMEIRENGDRMIEHTETFDPDWTGGETTVHTDYIVQGGGTLMRTAITYSSAAARDAVLASEMSASLGAAYARLDAVLAAG